MNEMKELIEQRGELIMQMDSVLEGVRAEKRAFTDEEQGQFNDLSAEITRIDATIEAERRAVEEKLRAAASDITQENGEDTEKRAAESIVADYIRGIETRADEMTTTSTGRIVPSEFSSDIIHKTTELCGILNRISIVNSKGDYKQIIADNENKISAGWTDEIGEITASSAKFNTITIGHHKLTSLVKLSLELINQNDFDIVSEVAGQMIEDFALKAETAIINGDGSSKPYGLTTGGTAYELPAAAFTSDDIVKIFHSLKANYQPNAAWLMSNSTLCAIRLLKDGNGQYIFHQNELTNGYVGTILGKPVLISEAMDNIEAGKTPVLFGDFGRAYKANINPDMSMQVLNEKYAEYAMKGIVGILWIDGRPVNNEAYVAVSVAGAEGEAA